MYQFILAQPSDKYEYFMIQRSLRTATAGDRCPAGWEDRYVRDYVEEPD